MVYTSLKELIQSFFEEIKKALKAYMEKQESALKARLKKILILSITGMVLLALAVSMAGTAAIFFLIGSLRYLETFLPPWQAWMIMATTAGIVAAALFVTLYIIIRKQLAPSNPNANLTQQASETKKATVQAKQEA